MYWATIFFLSSLVTLLTPAQFVHLNISIIETFSDETMLSSLSRHKKEAGEWRTCPENPIYSLVPRNAITLLLCQCLQINKISYIFLRYFQDLKQITSKSSQTVKPSMKLFCGFWVNSTWLQTFWKLSSLASWCVSAAVFQCFHLSLWYIPTQSEKGPFLAAWNKLLLTVCVT